MVVKYSILIIFLYLFVSKNSFPIESALHEAELAKCLGIFMTIKNNDFNYNHKEIAINTLTIYKDKIERLKWNEMTKEMSDKGAETILNYNKKNLNTEIKNLLNSCIMTFRVGN